MYRTLIIIALLLSACRTQTSTSLISSSAHRQIDTLLITRTPPVHDTLYIPLPAVHTGSAPCDSLCQQQLTDALSRLVGIETPVNLLFLLAIIMLMGISLHLTLAISKITDDMRTLAEEVAIMKALQRQPQGASRATEREQKKP